MNEPTPVSPPMRRLDSEALRALAHPLRVEMYEALTAFGPATASGLAARLGESSGSTSYHLRQLARHGLVREVEGRGSGRERWWERTPGGVSVSYYDHDDEAGRTAAQMVARGFERNRAALLETFQSNPEAVGREWYDASELETCNITASISDLERIREAYRAFDAEYLEPLRRRTPSEGSRRVQVHFNAFPLIGAQRHASEQDPS